MYIIYIYILLYTFILDSGWHARMHPKFIGENDCDSHWLYMLYDIGLMRFELFSQFTSLALPLPEPILVSWLLYGIQMVTKVFNSMERTPWPEIDIAFNCTRSLDKVIIYPLKIIHQLSSLRAYHILYANNHQINDRQYLLESQ